MPFRSVEDVAMQDLSADDRNFIRAQVDKNRLAPAQQFVLGRVGPEKPVLARAVLGFVLEMA